MGWRVSLTWKVDRDEVRLELNPPTLDDDEEEDDELPDQAQIVPIAPDDRVTPSQPRIHGDCPEA